MWDSLMAALVFGVAGIVLSIVGYKVFDLVETRVDFADEIKKGNTAVAIVVGAFVIGICIIIGRAVGS
jgi:putative membrane protein